MSNRAEIRKLDKEFDVCVVGGGMAGLCAAVAAARHGATVALIHERPVLGGNASSEVRMWICGAQGLDCTPNPDLLESGIIEEIRLKNMYRNPYGNWSLWDSVLYEIVRDEPNIEMFLNASVLDATAKNGHLESVLAWQMTTQTKIQIKAKIFVDSSGDGILIPFSGADYRLGRESSSEFGEDIQPTAADSKTMGLSCLLQTRETDKPCEFIPPEWAYVYENDEDLNNRPHDLHSHNFWWLELGGDMDSIHDAEKIKDELLKCAFGIWDHIKNRGDHGAENWVLEWVGFLPGKRESRRYVGDHIMTQHDIRQEGRFQDLIAYGGWPMDDHHPAGMKHKGDPTAFHPAAAPYGISYRCLYSHNVDNLMCAGRNISVTHAALSSTRVMATCSVIGQATGTAAAIAVKQGVSPRQVGRDYIHQLQEQLLEDGCYLPWHQRQIPTLTYAASLSVSGGTDGDALRNGWGRPVNGTRNGWQAKIGDAATYSWSEPQTLRSIRLVFDSNLSRGAFGKSLATNMPCRYTLEFPEQAPPSTLVKSFRIEALQPDGTWTTIQRVDNNYQRLVNIPIDCKTSSLRLVIESSWGDDEVTVFEWDAS